MKYITSIILSFLFAGWCLSQGRYMEVEEFLSLAFGDKPSFSSVWLDQETRDHLKVMTGKEFNQIRVRYWNSESRTAWILQEVGKDELITVGIVVDQGMIDQVRVLEFREPRGWEIRYPFFTDQYKGLGFSQVVADDMMPINGITGATLSVDAVNRMAKTALVLNELVMPVS